MTVAPKAWRTDPARHFSVEREEWPLHLRLSLFETERLFTVREPDDVTELLWDVLGASRRERSGSPSWDSSMLVPDAHPRGAAVYAPFPERDLEADTVDVLRLFKRVDLLLAHTEELAAGWASSPLHQPLLHRRFLDLVKDRLDTVRPGYRYVTEWRSTVRGRISPLSLARWQGRTTTQVQCRYSELTLSTQLLGCIVAALEWIADGRGVRSRLPGEYSDRRLRHDAVILRRGLAEIAGLAPSEALHAGPRLRLNRIDQPWQSALHAALAVLARADAVASKQDTTRVQAVELSVPTDKLWERIVHEALQRVGFHDVVQQASAFTQDPWVEHALAVSHTYPDNVARTSDEVFIVDAKYKTPLDHAPSRDDQYQMFAYSHLVRDIPRVVRAAVLVYPGRAEPARWIRGRDESRDPVRLVGVQVPFPSRSEVATAAAWSRYLDVVGAKLRGDLELVGQAMATPA